MWQTSAAFFIILNFSVSFLGLLIMIPSQWVSVLNYPVPVLLFKIMLEMQLENYVSYIIQRVWHFYPASFVLLLGTAQHNLKGRAAEALPLSLLQIRATFAFSYTRWGS